MAATVTAVRKRATAGAVRTRTDELRVAQVSVVFSGTYTTGGEAVDISGLDANIFPAAKIVGVSIFCHTLPLFLFTWDSANKKIVAFSMATGAQLANGNAGLAGNTATALVLMKG
jgi:hypothetical protein